MMKKIILAAMVGLLSAPATAQNFSISYAPGGGGMTVSTMVKDYLNSKGYTVELKSLGNCALVKNEWDSTKEKFITLYEEGFLSKKNEPCNIKFNDTNYIHMMIQGNYYFCSVPGKDPELWRKSEVNYTVGHPQSLPMELLFSPINEKNKNTAKLVSYKNLGAVATALAAKEVDYVFVTSGVDKITAEGGKCFWTTAPESMAFNKIPNVSKEFPGNKAATSSVNTFLLAKNFSTVEMDKLRKDIDTFLRSEEWIKYLKSRDLPNTINLTVSDQIKLIQNNIETLNTTK
jgi:tripartite-type tricarboxylate transporter receptor subunit TctC